MNPLPDTLDHFTDSQHVTVFCYGKWYVLDVIAGGRQLTPIELEKQIIWIEVFYFHAYNITLYYSFLSQLSAKLFKLHLNLFTL